MTYYMVQCDQDHNCCTGIDALAKDRAQFPAWVQAERIEAHDSEKLGAAGDPGSTRLAAGFKRKIPLAPYSASSAGQRAC